MNFTRLLLAASCVAVLALQTAIAAEPEAAQRIEQLENFEKGADHWQPTDAKAWKIEKIDGRQVYSQFKKRSDYNPPHRSPYNIALLKDVTVGDFVLTAKVKSTHEDYPHRDACLFFGYQDPAHFYYVHLGKRADDHANQIFIVNNAPRTKISQTSTEGTPWTDEWHNVKVERSVSDGAIKIYFDDMETPIMTATNKEFAWGQIGIGSFDDTTAWDQVKLVGEKAERKE